MCEDAVIHVEHRHILVNDNFEAGGIEAVEHGGELRPVEVVGGGQACQAGAGEEVSGEFVGDVEGVIADQGEVRGFFLIEAEGGEVADQQGVGVGVEELGEAPPLFFAGLEDSERGEGDGEAGVAAALDSGGVVLGGFEVEVDHADF